LIDPVLQRAGGSDIVVPVTEAVGGAKITRQLIAITLDADVETTTGTENVTAVLARAIALLSTACRGADSTPKPSPA
jgi:hypothetical protein